MIKQSDSHNFHITSINSIINISMTHFTIIVSSLFYKFRQETHPIDFITFLRNIESLVNI